LVFLCETWLNNSNKINLDSFENVSSFGRCNNIGKRNEGGLCLYCTPDILKGMEVVKEIEKDITLIRLKNEFFHNENDIYICFVYIPHEKSTYYNLNECDFFDLIEEVIFDYRERVTY